MDCIPGRLRPSVLVRSNSTLHVCQLVVHGQSWRILSVVTCSAMSCPSSLVVPPSQTQPNTEFFCQRPLRSSSRWLRIHFHSALTRMHMNELVGYIDSVGFGGRSVCLLRRDVTHPSHRELALPPLFPLPPITGTTTRRSSGRTAPRTAMPASRWPCRPSSSGR